MSKESIILAKKMQKVLDHTELAVAVIDAARLSTPNVYNVENLTSLREAIREYDNAKS